MGKNRFLFDNKDVLTLRTRTLGPCVLERKFVRLEPLRPQHLDSLAKAAAQVDWSIMLYPLLSREDVDERIKSGMEKEKIDEEYPFAVFLKEKDQLIGSTSYLTVSSRHKRAEIGSTWYIPEYQGAFVNPECKLLLLQHAFEDWHAVRIQLGTDMNNIRSQRAILKLGAKFEGRLRNYGIRPGGTPRDTMLYSIISSEWPEVKSGLVSRLSAYE